MIWGMSLSLCYALATILAVVFDETLQLHLTLTDTFKSCTINHSKDNHLVEEYSMDRSHPLEERLRLSAYFLDASSASTLLELLNGLEDALPLIQISHHLILLPVAMMRAGVPYASTHLSLYPHSR
jgi:hypothetical protein